jgi:zinc transport system ATP-binding protein
MKLIVDINNVTLSYDKTPVIEQANMQVFERDFIGVIGPNGGGKTTLLKGILGLLKPKIGTIDFGETHSLKHGPFGYLPQVKYLDKKFPITVFEVIRSGAIMHHNLFKSQNKVKARVEELLFEMEISEIRDKAIGELSGGQMQRVFLCRALVSDPELLILDEPGTFIENQFEDELYEKLIQLNEKRAIILVSHDMEMISNYVKTIVCVNRQVYCHPSNRISNEQLEVFNCPIKKIVPEKIHPAK